MVLMMKHARGDLSVLPNFDSKRRLKYHKYSPLEDCDRVLQRLNSRGKKAKPVLMLSRMELSNTDRSVLGM